MGGGWKRLRPIYPTGERGRPPYPLAMLLRIHCVQLFYNLSDPAMEDALYDSVAVQRFVGLAARDPRPDETTILNFRHLLEQHALGAVLLAAITRHLAAQGLRLREGTIVDATILDAPASTKNRAQARDPAMHQVKKGNQWYFGMKAHIGVDAATGLVHSVATTAANVADITQVPRLLHGAETQVWGDAGYAGVARRPEHRDRAIDWQVALRPGQRRRLAPGSAAAQAEQCKASIRAKSLPPTPIGGGASVLVREAPLRLRAGAVSGLGQEPHPPVPVVWARQSLAGGARRAGLSGRFAPRAGAHAACPAADGAPQPRNAVNPTPPGTLPLSRRSGTLVVQSFLSNFEATHARAAPRGARATEVRHRRQSAPLALRHVRVLNCASFCASLAGYAGHRPAPPEHGRPQ